MDIVRTDDGQAVLKGIRLFDQVAHQPIAALDHHAETPRILDLFDVEDSVQISTFQPGQVRLEDRVHEDNEHRPTQVCSRQPYSVGLAQELLLFDVAGRVGIIAGFVILLDLVAQPTDDKDELLHLHIQVGQLVQNVAQHRLASHVDQRLGLGPGMGSHPFAESRQGDDDFHEPLTL